MITLLIFHLVFCVLTNTNSYISKVLDKYKWEDLEDCNEEEICPYLDPVTFMLLQSIVQSVQGILSVIFIKTKIGSYHWYY